MNTEILADIKWLAVLLAAAVYFLLGAAWYSKILFGHKWASYVKLDMSNPDLKKGMGGMMGGSFILMLVAAIGLALLIVKFDFISVFSGVKLGLLTGICFSATAVSVSFIYERKPAGHFLIDAGYHIAGNVAAAVVLVLMR